MNYIVTGEQMTAIADAIREKTGESDDIEFPEEFISEIGKIAAVTEGQIQLPAQDRQISPGMELIGQISFETAVKSITITSSSQLFRAADVYIQFEDSTVNLYVWNAVPEETLPLNKNTFQISYEII